MKKFLIIMLIFSFIVMGESRAEYKHTYDDQGRLSSVGDYYTINFSYNENNEVTGGSSKYVACGGTEIEVSVLIDNEDGTYFAGVSNYGLLIDAKGKILQEGGVDYGQFNREVYKYEYDEQDSKISRIGYNCGYANNVSECTQSTDEEFFTFDRDAFGNITAEYINGKLVASNSYSPAYLQKQEQECSAKGSCTACNEGKFLQAGTCVESCGESFKLNDGECDRIRYTPAEAAQYLKDTDNEIIMTFKVNR